MNENEFENTDSLGNSKLIMIVMTVIFLLGFTFYLGVSLSYLCKNLKIKRAKILVYWFDYIIILVLCVLFTAIYLIYVATGDGEYYNRTEEPKRLSLKENTIGTACYVILMILMLLVTNNIILDIIKNIDLIFLIKKALYLESNDLNYVSQKFKEANVMKIINPKRHFVELGISGIAYATIIIIYFIFLTKNKEVIKGIMTFCRVVQLLVFLLIYLNAFLVKYYKKLLLENNFASSNLILLKVYNMNSSKIVYFTDFLTYKTIVDFISNIPIILFYCLERLDRIPLIVSYLTLFLYIIFTGAIYLYVDKSLKYSHISHLVKKAFLLKQFNFNFGERERARLFEEFEFDYSEDESKIFQELDMTILQNENQSADTTKRITMINIKSQDEEEEVFIEDRKSRKSRKSRLKLGDNFAINSQCNYFIVYKLLYMYFLTNSKIYVENQKKMEEEAAPFKMFLGVNKDQNSSINLLFRTSKHKDIVDNIQRFSRLSKLAEKKITSSFKMGFNTLFHSIEEKEYREDFRRQYNLSDCSKIEFKIESLFNDILFQLFPFYQITVKDILASLDPSANKKLFVEFLKEEQGSDKPTLLSSTNGFYTYDSFLFFESYDTTTFTFEQLKKFLTKYNNYLLDVIKNVSYTFLPLIVGVYNIEVLGMHRLIIAYRHPLSFAPYAKFNHWINFVVTEVPEKIKVSANNAEIIDINEIEIKNNINLPIDEYEELKKIIDNDTEFVVNEMDFGTFPIGNLFVGNEISKIGYVNESSSNDYKDNNVTIPNENKTFTSLLKDQSFLESSLTNIKKQKKEGGSEIVSLFEKDYFMSNSDNLYTIKIYFTNFLRNTCELNEKEKEDKYKLTSKAYCDYVKNQLLAYLHKNDKLFGSSILSDSNVITSNRNTVKSDKE